MNKAFDDGMRYGVVYRMWVGEPVYPVSCGGFFSYLFFFRISLHRLRTFTFGLALVVGIDTGVYLGIWEGFTDFIVPNYY